MGFEQAGWECLWQVEWDKNCQQILQFHWPEIPKYEDVCDVDGTRLEPVDCIIFGSPCQDLSIGGHRAGFDGNRSNLFFEATRIIKEMREGTNNEYPKLAVWENVPGALSSNGGQDFHIALQTLADIGALEQEWHVLDAGKFGTPQRRRRLFLVAIFDPSTASRCQQEILPVPQGLSRTVRKNRIKGAQATRIMDEILMGDHPIAFNWANGGGYGNANPGLAITRDGTGPLSTSQVVAVATGDIARKLTPIEYERLMGWPDDHTRWKADGTEQADSHRYKQCGNGVATPVARWVAEHIGKLL